MSEELDPRRSKNVGSSEVGALWSIGETRYRLAARKAGLIEDGLPDSEMLMIGRLLEPAVAEVVKQKTGWHLRKVRRYCPHASVEGMAASPDYEILSHDDGPGVCEIKTMDLGVWLRNDQAPPLRYELQLQHQLACMNREWGCLAILVSNRNLHVLTRKRQPDAVAKIELEIPIFWEEVKSGQLPAPDYQLDTKTLIEIFRDTTAEKVLDLSLDDQAQEWALAYKAATEEEARQREIKQLYKAMLLEKIEDAERVILPHGKISAKAVPPKHVEAYEKRGYRNFRVTVEDVSFARNEEETT